MKHKEYIFYVPFNVVVYLKYLNSKDTFRKAIHEFQS